MRGSWKIFLSALVLGLGEEASETPRVPGQAAAPEVPEVLRFPLIRPPPLRPGDTILLMAPASPCPSSDIKEAAANLTRRGYRVKISRTASKRVGYLAGTDQAVDQFGMMDDLKVESILAIVILQGAETVRTLGNDFFNALFFKQFYIISGHLFEDELIAQPSQAVPAAQFFLAQNSP